MLPHWGQRIPDQPPNSWLVDELPSHEKLNRYIDIEVVNCLGKVSYLDCPFDCISDSWARYGQGMRLRMGNILLEPEPMPSTALRKATETGRPFTTEEYDGVSVR
jgi:hypothetical protein